MNHNTNHPVVPVPPIPWMAQRLYALLPARVLCGPDYYALRYRPKEELVGQRYAKLNLVKRLLAIDLDVDLEDAWAIVHDPFLPPWSWCVRNHRNGHLHVAWLVSAPVNGERKRLRAMWDDVYARLCRYVGADPRHNGRGVIPNPLFEGAIDVSTQWGCVEPMRLGDMFEWLPETAALLDTAQGQGLPLTGSGRNVDVFNALRVEAYRTVATARKDGWSKERFAEHVAMAAVGVNAELADPLPERELRSTARSVARYAWQQRATSNGASLSERQAARCVKRHALTRKRNAGRDARIRRLHRSGRSTREIAAATGLSRGGVLWVLGRG